MVVWFQLSTQAWQAVTAQQVVGGIYENATVSSGGAEIKAATQEHVDN